LDTIEYRTGTHSKTTTKQRHFCMSEYVSKLVFYAQSTGTVITERMSEYKLTVGRIHQKKDKVITNEQNIITKNKLKTVNNSKK